MRRREFIAGLGSAAAWPLAARAQQPAMPVIGLLRSGMASPPSPFIVAFFLGLKDAGFVEGQNILVESRWTEDRNERLPALAADLVRRQVNLITALGNTQAARAAKAATDLIPIVFTIASDPVDIGLVASLSRPGGNVTGVSQLGIETVAKRLEVLRKLVPAATSIAVLNNPTNPRMTENEMQQLEPAARTLGLQLRLLNAQNEIEIETAFADTARQPMGALLVGADGFFVNSRELIAAAAARHRVPAIYHAREYALAGGLMSYGPSLPDAFRQAGVYAGRILKGERPADLPVYQSVKIELVINLKTAKALGLTIPETLLATADQVIE